MKNNGQYIGKYLKSNVFVLICELVVVLLLGFICTFIVGGEPMWLAPVLAFVAYLLAELRFMMAYVATNVRRDRAAEADAQPAAPAVVEQQEEQPAVPEAEEDDQMTVPLAAAMMAEKDEQEEAAEEESAPVAEQAEETPAVEATPVQQSIDMDEEDEAVEALFAEYMAQQNADEPVIETATATEEDPTVAPERLETIEVPDEDDETSYTMDAAASDAAPVARDVLDIGEIDAK